MKIIIRRKLSDEFIFEHVKKMKGVSDLDIKQCNYINKFNLLSKRGYYLQVYIQYIDKNGLVLQELPVRRYEYKSETKFLNELADKGGFYKKSTRGNRATSIDLYYTMDYGHYTSYNPRKIKQFVPLNILKDTKQIKVKEVWLKGRY